MGAAAAEEATFREEEAIVGYYKKSDEVIRVGFECKTQVQFQRVRVLGIVLLQHLTILQKMLLSLYQVDARTSIIVSISMICRTEVSAMKYRLLKLLAYFQRYRIGQCFLL